MMKKDLFSIDSEERNRILSLHENATKKQYLIFEQKYEKAWRLCGFIIYLKNGEYFCDLGNGESVQIPTLSQLGGVASKNNIEFNDLTYDALELGYEFSMRPPCSNTVRSLNKSQTGKVYYVVYFDDMTGSKGFPIINVLSTDGGLQTGVDEPEMTKTEVLFSRKRTKNFYIEIGMGIKGTEYQEPTKPTPSETPVTTTIALDIVAPFKYDKTELEDAAKTQFYKFINELNMNLESYDGPVEVVTSASIDADPAQKNINGFPTRKDYNLDLSKRRAEAIIAELESKIRKQGRKPNFKFVAKPLGETEQFAKGMKWPEVKDQTKTAPNRRLQIILPQVTKKSNTIKFP